jgi:hypothetical protein
LSNYRNRKLLDLAHQLPCQCCGRGEASEPAHSNFHQHGKGMSIKAHDVFFAALCHDCHRELDQGKSMTFDKRFDMWQRAHDKTLLEIFRRGLVRVL